MCIRDSPCILGADFIDRVIRMIYTWPQRALRTRYGDHVPMLPRTPTKPRRAPTPKTTRPTEFAPVRVARRTSIPPHATQAIEVTTGADGRCIMIPATDLYGQKLLRLANGETQVKRNVPFSVHMHNAGTRLQILPKGMKVGAAVPNPVGCLQVALRC